MPPQRPRSLRPWYLVATMLLTWFIGVRGFVEGCGTATFLRSGTVPDVTAVAEQARDQGGPFLFTFLVGEAARQRALSDHQDVSFPLSVADILLGGLLVVASGLALGGRPGTRAFALQVLAANLVFAVVDYELTRGVRGAWITMVAQAGTLLPPDTPEQARSWTDPALLWMGERMRFVLSELCVLSLAALALTRARTKTYFEAVAQAAPRSEEP